MPDGREVIVAPADDAGKFRLSVVASDPWHALLHQGRLSDLECAAADAHAATWAATGWSAPGRSGYEPAVSSVQVDVADRIGAEEMEAWRMFRLAQTQMPLFCRGIVMRVVAYYQAPADHEVRALKIGLRRLARFYGV